MLYILVNATHDGDDFLGVFDTEETALLVAKQERHQHDLALITMPVNSTNPREYTWVSDLLK